MLRIFKYQTPFSEPFHTSVGTLTNREGLVLSFEKDEITAFGEISPLPGFSNETLEQVIQVLQHNRTFLNSAFLSGDEETIISLLDSIHQFPSLSFGLDTLLADLKAKQSGLSLHHYLFEDEFERVASNFALGITSTKDMLNRVNKLISEGYTTIKFKVGRDFSSEHTALKSIRKKFPELTIRIDANQAWTKNEAVSNLNQLKDLNLEYCEQPVPASEFEALKYVTGNTDVPVAADESARTIQDVRDLIQQKACKVLILKPMLFGRFNNLIVTKELAITHNIEVVLTTSFEGVIGRTATAILASGLGSQKLAHGLATGIYLDEGDSDKAEIQEGFYRVSKQPGLGSPVDLKYLEEIS